MLPCSHAFALHFTFKTSRCWSPFHARSGGGVLLACSQKISSIRRSELETDCEIMWCEIVISNPYSRIMVGVFYRPPSTDVSYLLELGKSLCLLCTYQRRGGGECGQGVVGNERSIKSVKKAPIPGGKSKQTIL